MDNKILVAIPTTGLVDIDYVNSIIKLSHATKNIQVVHSSGSLVYVARNSFVKDAIEGNYTHLLFIDSDMVFNADALNVLLHHNLDIVSGSIFTRVAPYKPCYYEKLKLGDSNEVICEPCKDMGDDLIKVEGVGTAFLLTKTKVFQDIIDKQNVYPFQPIPGYGEDLSFCLRARKCGYEIFVDNGLMIGHIGKTIVTKQTYMNQQETR